MFKRDQEDFRKRNRNQKTGSQEPGHKVIYKNCNTRGEKKSPSKAVTVNFCSSTLCT